jgi:hypothetical protein
MIILGEISSEAIVAANERLCSCNLAVYSWLNTLCASKRPTDIVWAVAKEYRSTQHNGVSAPLTSGVSPAKEMNP